MAAGVVTVLGGVEVGKDSANWVIIGWADGKELAENSSKHSALGCLNPITLSQNAVKIIRILFESLAILLALELILAAPNIFSTPCESEHTSPDQT